MRNFGTIIDKHVKLRDPRVPDQRMARVSPPVLGRLDEEIKDLFDYACVAGDLDSAADLLALMEKWHERDAAEAEPQRQLRGILLKRMCGELNRRHIMRGSPPPNNSAWTPGKN